jgi:hypothetical protein
MNNYNEEVRRAFQNAELIDMGGVSYQQRLIDQRLELEGVENTGSAYDLSAEDLKDAVMNANWIKTTHPNVKPELDLYVTEDIPYGRTGIMDINLLPDNTEFYATNAKTLGYIGMGAANVSKIPDSRTYMIVGTEYINGIEQKVTYTFHPGEPIDPSTTKENLELYEGRKMTKKEVMDYGFSKVKYLSPSIVREYERGYLFEKQILSSDESQRAGAAMDEKCNAHLLSRLAEDPSPNVRLEVAKNINTPVAVLLKIQNDRTIADNEVAKMGQFSLSIGDHAKSSLLRIASDDGRHLPQGIRDLEAILNSDDEILKGVMSINECTPIEYLVRLANDHDFEVASDARNTLTGIMKRPTTSIELKQYIISNVHDSQLPIKDIDPRAAVSMARQNINKNTQHDEASHQEDMYNK